MSQSHCLHVTYRPLYSNMGLRFIGPDMPNKGWIADKCRYPNCFAVAEIPRILDKYRRSVWAATQCQRQEPTKASPFVPPLLGPWYSPSVPLLSQPLGIDCISVFSHLHRTPQWTRPRSWLDSLTRYISLVILSSSSMWDLTAKR